MAEDRATFLRRLSQTGPLGYGASSLGNLYQRMDDAAAQDTVDAAWGLGLRYFDTAPFYGFGLGERRLGDALRKRDRDDFILSTKVGRLLVPGIAEDDRFGFHSPMPFDPVFDYSYDGVMRSVEASLHRLGLSRIDMLYMHDLGELTHGARHPHYLAQATSGGFGAMQSLKDQGVVSAIGLGVNELDICVESFRHVDFDLFLVAGCYTLLEQGAAPFFNDCHQRGIGIIAAGVFNSGILAGGTKASQVYFDYAPAPDIIIKRVEAIEQCCAAFGVPMVAAALQFVTRLPAVTIALFGADSAAKIAQAIDLNQFPIPTGLWTELRTRGLIESDVVTAEF